MPSNACRVERLRLFRFRNYSEESVELGPGLNVVVGENAQGKTNLLEAVATVALTRSPRAGSAGEVIGWGEPACRVSAHVVRPDAAHDVEVTLRRAETERVGRSMTVDGKERAARAVLGLCPVVLFWPEDLQLVKGGPEGRRRLLDIVLSQTDARAADDLVRYRRVMEQRNASLRMVRDRLASFDAVEAFTRELVAVGGRIRVARTRLVRSLEPLASEALAELTDGREVLGLRYVGEGVDASATDADALSASLASLLAERRGEEIARGVTVAGPHRDDVEFLLDARPARSTASQGQQRSMVLACKLAEVRHVGSVARVAPVLLLDDVLSELDAGRRLRLLAALGAGSTAQALLTTSETAALDLPAGADVRRFTVRGGHVGADPALRVEAV
ncbi:MAG TPA: DNA replication/repair protein RecF [Candidatus Angelobacter sp.]|jgi:DNA replication and repair protein RecF|nr:DNA replication/repair protein RecF [Candidatus Angelobacter sp.]